MLRDNRTRRIYKTTNLTQWLNDVREALNQDIKLDLVKSKYKQINNSGAKNKYYYLSPKGLRLLNIINEVDNL